MKAETTVAVEAFARLERKKHQMEKSERELNTAVEAVEDAEMAAYVDATTRLTLEFALTCRNGCAAEARSDLIQAAIDQAASEEVAKVPKPEPDAEPEAPAAEEE